MAGPGLHFLLILGLLLVLLPSQANAFGAGNIASISAIEGKNWRHGDIEDMLKMVACIKGHKWTSTMIKRVYFGNWLRDYSQAMDVGTLKSLPADTIRVLVWILSFLTFGFATGEFEVTADRLGVYRPEEHIDNPKHYADDQDAREFDKRLRGPVRQVELDIDPHTGMKNYIANEQGDWATSAAYIKYSLARSIHYGRTYTHGGRRGDEADLCEALRCLGQGLHTLEDFAAHTNYIELALREMGFHNVFPHTGVNTQITLRGHRVFPLVTGTFGMVDFFHSVLGEATDHFTQSEVNEMDLALGDAQANSSGSSLNNLTGLLGNIPGTKELVTEAEDLQRKAQAQESSNKSAHSGSGYTIARELGRGLGDNDNDSQRASENSKPGGPSGALADFDPAKTISQIYPILQFRDKVVRTLTSIIEKIPGLEAMVEKISETLTVFVMSLLAPFVRPLINAASKSLQTGSAGVIDASGKHQYEPWTDPHCTDPTHSLLSKDHFANILNEPAGQVGSAILQYVAPRVLYAWQHIDISEQQVLHDCLQVFHHPAVRDMHNEAHRNMFEAVKSWAHARPDRGSGLNDVLSAEGVRSGKNTGGQPHTHQQHGGFAALGKQNRPQNRPQQQHHQPQHQSQQQSGSGVPWDKLDSLGIPGVAGLKKLDSVFSGLNLGGGSSREQSSSESRQSDNDRPARHSPQPHYAQPQPSHHQSAHHSPQPHYAQHQPVHHSPQPHYAQHQPVHHSPQPHYSQHQPTHYQSEPPREHYSQPVHHHQHHQHHEPHHHSSHSHHSHHSHSHHSSGGGYSSHPPPDGRGSDYYGHSSHSGYPQYPPQHHQPHGYNQGPYDYQRQPYGHSGGYGHGYGYGHGGYGGYGGYQY